MLRLVIFIASISVPMLGIGADLRDTQDYPNKPIRLIAPEPGGSGDLAARLVAQGISGPLGQSVIVDNRGSTVSAQLVLQAAPDGYTLYIGATAFWVSPLLQDTSYDPVRDFVPVSTLTRTPSILVVHPSLPANSVKELVALAKAKPGVLNYGSSGTGGSPHLAAELFKAMAGINIVRINYKGAGPAVTALLGNEIQISFITVGGVLPHVNSGRLRAIAVTSSEPSPLVPGLPTIASAGLPEYESVSILCMFARAKTPAAIINRLNREIVELLTRPAVKDKFFTGGVEASSSSPQRLAAIMNSEILKTSKLIKDAGLHL